MTQSIETLAREIGDKIADIVGAKISTEFNGFWAKEDLVDEIPSMIREAAQAIRALT